MHTRVFYSSKPELYIDDSEYERFEGVLSRRPAPGLAHADFQHHITGLLRPVEERLGGRVAQEWSISDGSGNWLTPDVTFSYPEFKTTRRGHLLAPVYLWSRSARPINLSKSYSTSASAIEDGRPPIIGS
jgi:hypothetical protein